MHRLVGEPEVAEDFQPALLAVSYLEARVAAERPDSHDQHVLNRNVTAARPGRRIAKPPDRRHRHGHEMAEVAAGRVARHRAAERVERNHEDRDLERRERRVADHFSAVEDIVMPEHSARECPHEHCPCAHAERHEPVEPIRPGEHGRRERPGDQDQAVTDQIYPLGLLLRHRGEPGQHVSCGLVCD